MGQKKSSSWLNRQRRDPYVQQAKQSGYRSRASFKLLELNQAHKLFSKKKTGARIIDLGAAPGGWSQILATLLGKNAHIYAIDLLDMPPLAGVNFIKGDFREPSIQATLKEALPGNSVDWIVSDMAPNLSGVLAADQARMMDLAEAARDFAMEMLADNGGFLIKLFQGADVKPFFETVKPHFKRTMICKPDASRSASREVYLLAQGYKNSQQDT